MPKHADEHGLKKRAKGSDKARRSFELNGQYSQKHLHLREEELVKRWSGQKAEPEKGKQR